MHRSGSVPVGIEALPQAAALRHRRLHEIHDQPFGIRIAAGSAASLALLACAHRDTPCCSKANHAAQLSPQTVL